ncbi:MAG: calcium-translocating P-type ATPase, PMCA-type [Hormoscilla sp. GM102CHS1]|nr:calcium-translocating P-type ATPase, PMCA-type [Hormoscilla sp. GM102CHS1]
MTVTVERNPKIFQGLTAAEVESSRQKYGSNLLTPPERDPWWQLFLEKFEDPIIRILMVAAFLAIVVGIFDGNITEGIGIVIAILLATTVAFFNEYKANEEFEILNQVNDEVPIKVIREGNFTTVPKKDLVVGDIVFLEIGEEVPADGQVLEAVSLQINEASLTGEGVPVTKVATEMADKYAADFSEVCSEDGKSSLQTSVHETAYPADKALRGTIIADGRATLELTAVGDGTEIGKTSQAATIESDQDTPLNIQLDRLSRLIGVLGFAVAVLIDIALIVRGILTGDLNLTPGQWYFTGLLAVSALAIGLVRVWLPIVYDAIELTGGEAEPPEWLENESLLGWAINIGLALAVFGAGIGLGYAFNWIPQSPSDWIPTHVATEFLTYFMIAVTIIVVAVPEGLALSVTLSLAYSMRKMTQQNNLVRRMNACETIGAATAICSDKTGTLTLNAMRVFDIKFPYLTGEITGDTLKDAGKLVVEAITVNTTANLEKKSDAAPNVLGNPTEGALLLWLDDREVPYFEKREEFPITYQWTFSTERKYMATLGNSLVTGNSILHIKGAPEILLDRCNSILTPDGIQPLGESIAAELNSYQERGMRTLGFAYRENVEYVEGVEIDNLARDLIWLGFAAIADPVRPDVPAAVAVCQKAGVMVKVVTGDILPTAKEVARAIGLAKENDPSDCFLTGPEFAAMDDRTAKAAAMKLKVLARSRPLDKLRLVKLLQDSGQVVAVTGDGTNDAPALNQAQVGLAMGKTGTSVAKEASDIIILDDSFGSIENAVMWGRSLYQNIQKFILFQSTINVAACFIALLGPFIGINLPLTVVQLLWVNLIMDTFAALALATEPPSEKVMNDPPRDPEAFIISKPMAVSIFSVGIIFLVFLVGFLLKIQQDGDVNPYELSLFFSTFIMLQFWNMFNAKCFGLNNSAFSKVWENRGFITIALLIFVGQILMVQFGGDFFRTVPISLHDWLIIIGGTSVVLWIGEIWRLISRLTKKSDSTTAAATS